jgi:hypothetical protein
MVSQYQEPEYFIWIPIIGKARKDTYKLFLNKLEGCVGHIQYPLLPFFSLLLKSGARKPFRKVFHCNISEIMMRKKWRYLHNGIVLTKNAPGVPTVPATPSANSAVAMYGSFSGSISIPYATYMHIWTINKPMYHMINCYYNTSIIIAPVECRICRFQSSGDL